MYLKFFELNQKPFQISTDPRFLWLGETHKEALAMLKYGVMDNRGFIMLTGNVGTGKTTLINALINKLGPNVIVANIADPGLEQLDFFNYLAHRFKLADTYATKGEFLIAFQTFLERCFRDRKQVLLIVDEAQHITPKMLEQIRLLSNIEHQDGKLLNIFLVGQDELNKILDRHENRPLRQRITLRYHLEPLTAVEMYSMIHHRLKTAGTTKKIFTTDAVKEIYIFSRGYPRLVNILCDHAMITGYAANKKTIDADIIRECAKDLRLPGLKVKKSLPKNTQANTQPAVKNTTAQNASGLNNKSAKPKSIRVTVKPVIRNNKNVNTEGLNKSQPSTEDESPAPGSKAGKTNIGQIRDRHRAPSNGTPPSPDDSPAATGSAPSQAKNNRAVNKILTYGAILVVLIFLTAFFYFPLMAGVSINKTHRYWIERTKKLLVKMPDQSAISVLKKSLSSKTPTSPSGSSGISVAAPADISHVHPSSPDDEDGKDQNTVSSRIAAKGETPPNTLMTEAKPEQTRHSSKNSDIPAEKQFILRLPEDGYKRLDHTANVMESNPSIKLVVRGYTDSIGTESYNQMLSKVRANVVKNYLVGKGIAPERITCIPRGADNPIADNENPEGRYANRRVEVEMVF